MTRVTGKTKIVGVWGHPVSHSRSPAMHNAAFRELGLDWAYLPFDVAPADVEAALGGLVALGIIGVNVTVPLKVSVLPYLDLSAEAQQIGSVNTISHHDGKLYGDSTDGRGFLRSLIEAGYNPAGCRALILGAGGAARAVVFALASLGSFCQITNRSPERAESLSVDVNRVYPGSAATAEWGSGTEPFDLLVNTTSLGMHPNEDELPALPPDVFAKKPFVYDLIYTPEKTKLLALAENAGCQILNGIPMLVHQGALSQSIWTGLPVEKIPIRVMEEAVRTSL